MKLNLCQNMHFKVHFKIITSKLILLGSDDFGDKFILFYSFTQVNVDIINSVSKNTIQYKK